MRTSHPTLAEPAVKRRTAEDGERSRVSKPVERVADGCDVCLGEEPLTGKFAVCRKQVPQAIIRDSRSPRPAPSEVRDGKPCRLRRYSRAPRSRPDQKARNQRRSAADGGRKLSKNGDGLTVLRSVQRPTSPSTGTAGIGVHFLRNAAGPVGETPGSDGQLHRFGHGRPDPARRRSRVFINTPSAPSSIASAASEAVPTPASTMSGTRANSRMMRRLLTF